MHERHRRQQAWNHYWSSGVLHSCDSSLSLEGVGPLAQFWRTVFAEIPAHARVLDVATGNGGLLKAALTAMPAQANWQLAAVDLAQPRMDWLQAHPRAHCIQVHAETSMEQLPFAAGAFDRVISQFGIEYGAPEASLGECLRVLSDHGQVALVLHHADSIITQVSRDELQGQCWLLSRSGLLNAARALLPHLAAMRSGQAPDARAEAARQGYNQSMAEMAHLIESQAAPDLLIHARDAIHGWVAQLQAQHLNACQDALARYRDDLEDAQLRSNEQIEVAMDTRSIEQFVAPLRAGLKSLDVSTITQGQHILAWAVRGHSPIR